MEDWFHQMGNPLKIKNLLTYLLTYLSGLTLLVRNIKTKQKQLLGLIILARHLIAIGDFRKHYNSAGDIYTEKIQNNKGNQVNPCWFGLLHANVSRIVLEVQNILQALQLHC